MSTYRSPPVPRGNSHFTDYDGVLTDTKFQDSIRPFSWDMTDALESGESVSSVSYDEQGGISVSSAALASNIWSCNITNTGVLEVTATLSTGRTLFERFRWEARNEGDSDYKS